MKECVIAVIGAGATALSLLDALIDEARAEPDCPRLIVYLIETRRLRGRGLAYEDDLATNLLNTRAGFITPFPKRPGHFFAWLQENEAAWRHEFPGLVVDAQTFVPRPLFGLYLECMMGELAGELMRIGGTLVPVTAEATDLEPTPEGRVVVSTDTALAIRADRVVLSLGNLQAREEDEVERLPGFFANPYPIRRLAHRIARDASVAIVGARLSAIDVALGLLSSGHDGPLTMISRSGYLPAVRGTQGRYKPRILTQETIAAHLARHGRVRLAELVRWVEDEIELAGGRRAENAVFPPEPPADPLAFLEGEIAAAAHPRPWQAVLYATNGLVDMLWRALPEEERSLFLARFQAAWMAYRVSIPVENARRLLAAGRSGRLAFRSGESVVAPGEGGGFSLRIGRDGGAERFDAVVCAYGSPRDPRRLDSRLVGNILARGLARPHRHGGLDVVPESGRLIEADGTESLAISALGELTAGVHFFTSALEINARHAAGQARSLVHGIVHAPRELAAPVVPLSPLRSRDHLVEAG